MRITRYVNQIVRGPDFCAQISTKSVGWNFYESIKKNINRTEPALHDVSTKQSKSYQSLFNDTVKLASWMRGANYRRNDVVSICSENSLDFMTPVISAQYEGVTIACINHSYVEREILQSLNLIKPKVAFCSKAVCDTFMGLKKRGDIPYVNEVVILEELQDKLSGVPEMDYEPTVCEDTLNHTSTILFSSGTTGLPKGVRLSHHNLNARQIQAEDPRETICHADNHLVIVPFYHVFGYMITNAIIRKGKTLQFLPKFSPTTYLQAIQDYKFDFIMAAPPIVVFLAKSPLVDDYDLSSIKHIISGAAPLSHEVQVLLKQRLPNVRITQGYGLTESTFTVIGHGVHDDGRCGSTGTVTAGHEVMIRDPGTGNRLGPNEVGEVCARGPLVMQGYFDNEKATKETIIEDGWCRTGDIGYFDNEKNFFIVDRLKELIKYKGFQVAPAELEDLLLRHDSICDAAVVGLPDEECGELPVAFVVRRDKADISDVDVLSFIDQQVCKAKRLHYVKFVDSIPKTPSGKLLRKELRTIVQQVRNYGICN